MPRAIVDTSYVDGGVLLVAHIPGTDISTSTFMELPTTFHKRMQAHTYLLQELEELRGQDRGQMTGTQKGRYVRDRGEHCPFCGSDKMYRYVVKRLGSGEVVTYAKCNACDKTVEETYKLADVGTVEEASDGEVK